MHVIYANNHNYSLQPSSPMVVYTTLTIFLNSITLSFPTNSNNRTCFSISCYQKFVYFILNIKTLYTNIPSNWWKSISFFSLENRFKCSLISIHRHNIWENYLLFKIYNIIFLLIRMIHGKSRRLMRSGRPVVCCSLQRTVESIDLWSKHTHCRPLRIGYIVM